MVARDVVDSRSHLLTVDVERCGDAQLKTLTIEIARNGLAEVTHTDDSHIHRLLAI